MANIRVREAAGYLGLSKSTLDKMRCYGNGPRYFKVGKAVIYSTEDLKDWLASKRQANTWDANNQNLRVSERAAA